MPGLPPEVGDTALSINDIGQTLHWTLESVTLQQPSPRTHDFFDGSTKIGTFTTNISTSPNANGRYDVSATATGAASGYSGISVVLAVTEASHWGLAPSSFPANARIGSFHAPTRSLGVLTDATVTWEKEVWYGFWYPHKGTSVVPFNHVMNWRNEVWHCDEASASNLYMPELSADNF